MVAALVVLGLVGGLLVKASKEGAKKAPLPRPLAPTRDHRAQLPKPTPKRSTPKTAPQGAAKPAPTPTPAPQLAPAPTPTPAPQVAPVALTPRPTHPQAFRYEGVKGANVRALREYEDYKAGLLPLEKYPISWEEGEDYAVLKMSPWRWVVIDQEKIPLSKVIAEYAPSGATLRWAALGLTLALAPEALAALGIKSAVVTTALGAASIAHNVYAVIRAYAVGTDAAVAEVAGQNFAFATKALATNFQLKLAAYLAGIGVRLVVKGAYRIIGETP